MGGLKRAAAELRALLGPGVMLRRDRAGEALFVSDYPRRKAPGEVKALDGRVIAAGWVISGWGSLRLLDWPYAGYGAFFDGLPPGRAAGRAAGLVNILSRHPARFDPGMLPRAREALLLFDAGEMDRLMETAGSALAVCLREKTPLPSFYALLLSALR